jgi:hypothetical protein
VPLVRMAWTLAPWTGLPASVNSLSVSLTGIS